MLAHSRAWSPVSPGNQAAATGAMQQRVAPPQGDRLRVRAGLRRELYRQERVRAGVGGSLLFGDSRGVVGLSGQAKALATSFGDEEAEHVAALTKAITGLGGKPVKKPTFVFPANSAAGFLSLAYALENMGVGAYNGAGPSLSDKAILAAAGSIVQAEARHAASIAVLTNKSITPNGAFDKPLSMGQVLAKAGPLIKK